MWGRHVCPTSAWTWTQSETPGPPDGELWALMVIQKLQHLSLPPSPALSLTPSLSHSLPISFPLSLSPSLLIFHNGNGSTQYSLSLECVESRSYSVHPIIVDIPTKGSARMSWCRPRWPFTADTGATNGTYWTIGWLKPWSVLESWLEEWIHVRLVGIVLFLYI